MTAKSKLNAAGQVVTSAGHAVEEAHQRALKARSGSTATVKLRATEKGYYGYPVPDIIDAGTVFPFRVADLEARGAHAGREHISIGGTVYDLPTWCEDAKKPVVVVDEDEDEDDESVVTDDVI